MHRVTSDSKRGRQMASLKNTVGRGSTHDDRGVKAKPGWKYDTAPDGTVRKVRAAA